MPKDIEDELFGNVEPEPFALDQKDLDERRHLLARVEKMQQDTLEQISDLKSRLGYLNGTEAFKNPGHGRMVGGLERDLKSIEDNIAAYQKILLELDTRVDLLSPALHKKQQELTDLHLKSIAVKENELSTSITNFKQKVADSANIKEPEGPSLEQQRQKLYEDYFGQPNGKFNQAKSKLSDKFRPDYIKKLQTELYHCAYHNKDPHDLNTLIHNAVNRKTYGLRQFVGSSPLCDTVFEDFKQAVNKHWQALGDTHNPTNPRG